MTELWSNERTDLITMGSRYLRRLARHLGPDGGVVERQLPFVGVFLVALLTLLIPGVNVASQRDVVIAALLTVGQLVAARYLPWGRWPEGRQDILPIVQLLAVAFLRTGTGGPGSPYTTLVFFPVIALASQRDRRGIWIAGLGVAGVVLSPVLLTSDGDADRGRRSSARSSSRSSPWSSPPRCTRSRRACGPAATRSCRCRWTRRCCSTARAPTPLSLARVADQRRAARDALVSVIDSATEQAIIATDADGHGRGVQRRRRTAARVRAGRGGRTHAPDRLPRQGGARGPPQPALRRRLPGRQPAGARRRARRARPGRSPGGARLDVRRARRRAA